MRVAIAVLLAACLPACLGPGDFRCAEHKQCSGAGAFCEADGHCSVAVTDGSCPSRRRYVRNAGAASAACVPASCGENPIRALSAGGAHACLVREDGAVWCWGRNDDGQLGDGTRTPRSLAVRIGGLAAKAVAAGQRHSCAVTGTGSVACWGADDLGQLGDGGGEDRLSPMVVPGVAGAIAVAAGTDFSCAVLGDGTVRCWGDDTLGQLGDDGVAAATHLPTPVSGLSAARSLSAFSQHACAVRDDGSLWCWGANSQGQLGDGTLTNQKHPVAVPALAGVTAAGTGLSHTCAIASTKLLCWGSNAFGQLGTGSVDSAPVTTPALVPIVTSPTGVAVGAQHSCAIQDDGTVFCWGQDGSGQLGQGPNTVLPAPVQVPGLAGATAVVAGTAFSCAETADGAIFCWGDNHNGQLGMGSGTIRTLPAAVPDLPPADRVTAGGAHTCVTTSADGRPRCWGADQAGQLGDGDTTDRAHQEPIKADIQAADIAAGGAHTCAVTPYPDGALWCWGRGNVGQLGLGPTRLFDVRLPTQVVGPGLALAVAAGTAHSCVVASGAVLCFGANGNGQLGDGTTTDRSTPVRALGNGASVASAGAVAAGGAQTCALDSQGGLWCWGRSQLGNTTVDVLTPSKVDVGSAGLPVIALALGGAHACAITNNDVLHCWGSGVDGQLGRGSRDNADVPSAVSGVGDPVAVAAGTAHTCAISDGGKVFCWGANDSGQLGTGDLASSTTPVEVKSLAGVDQIAAGSAHTCARRATDKSVWCWGADTSGQLGDGVALAVTAPQLTRISCE